MNQSVYMFNEELTTSRGDSNSSQLNCPNITEDDQTFLHTFSYWVGGVGMLSIGISGLITNFAAIFVLSKSSISKKSFDRLIVALCIFDIVLQSC